MIDLERYGLSDEWPALAKLQAEVADLERRRGEAEGRVQAARQALHDARDKDAQLAGAAIRAGRSVPEPKHAQKAQQQLEAAERVVLGYQRALESAQTDLAAFMAEHSEEIQRSVMQALRSDSQRLRELMSEAAPIFGRLMDSKYDLRALTPPTPPAEPSGPGRDTTDFGGVITRANAYAEPHQRGDVEAVLGYLASLEDRYPEPTPEPVEAGQGAA